MLLPWKDWSKNIHGLSPYDSQRPSMEEWINLISYTTEYYIMSKNKTCTNTSNNMDESQKHVEQKKPDN